MSKYQSLFLSNNGSNIFTTIGFLKGIEDQIDRVEWWNVCGSSSLLVFLKIVGYNYEQIFEILSDLSLTSTFVNGSSLVPENEDEKKRYIREWLIEHLSNSEFFSKDIKLGEIWKKTKIFPNFILFSRKDQKITYISPSTHPKYKLVDCVMASLCYIGVYEEYSFMGDTFSNLCSVDCYPYLYISPMTSSNILYVGNVSKFEIPVGSILGPLSKKEGMIIRQFSEHEKYRIDSIFKNMGEDESVKLYSFYRQGKLSIEEEKTFFSLGLEQASAFKEKTDTEEREKKFVENIEAQT